MGLFKQIEGPTKAVLDQILDDPDLGEAIIYKRFIGQAYSESAGRNVDSYEEITLSGVRLRHSERTLKLFAGDIQIGDPVFIFRFADLPEGLSVKDLMVDANNKVLKVKSVDPIFKLAISISAEGA